MEKQEHAMPTANVAHPNRNLPATDEFRESLSDMAEDLKSVVSKAAPVVREQIHRATDNLADRAASMEAWLKTTAAEKPLQTVLLAAGIGLLAGLWLRSR
jgi:ElaB/YqjD/DUF883 family membrane-anchored ribosome-binding protein